MSLAFYGQDLHFPEGTLINFSNFARQLFQIIEDHKLIDGFVPPPIPDASEAFPNIRGETTSNADSGLGIEIGGPLRFEGAFGKLITEWPLPDRETEESEVSSSAG